MGFIKCRVAGARESGVQRPGARVGPSVCYKQCGWISHKEIRAQGTKPKYQWGPKASSTSTVSAVRYCTLKDGDSLIIRITTGANDKGLSG